MNIRLKFIMLMTLMAVYFGASAFTVGNLTYKILSETDRTVSITSWNLENTTDLILPDKVEYNGIPYTVVSLSIQSQPFNKSLKKIYIPETIVLIERGLNYNLEQLQEIIVDRNNPVYTSVDGVLYDKDVTELIYCPVFKDSVTIPSTVTTIKFGAFYGNEQISKIVLPEGLKALERSAFCLCYSLREISFPSTLETIGAAAFEHCAFESIELNDGLKQIGWDSFMACGNLHTVRIPASVEIERNPFMYCLSLTRFDVDPESERYCAEGPILLSKDKTRLISYPAATDPIIIPDYVSVIGEDAFFNHDIKTVVLPTSVTEVENGAFFEFNSLESVYCYPLTPPKLYTYSFATTNADTPEKLSFYVPAEAYEDYIEAWGNMYSSKRFRVIDSGIEGVVTEDTTDNFIVYGIDGRLILQTRNSEDLNSLKKGIYVINGKKTIVR